MTPLYTAADAETLANLLKPIQAIGWFSVSFSGLGGPENGSLIIKATADKREAWPCGIFENSRYAMFHLTADGKMEMFSGGGKVGKFRKCKAGSLASAAEKMARYFSA